MLLSLLTGYETISSFRIVFTGKNSFIWARMNKKTIFFVIIVLFMGDFLASVVPAEEFL